MESKIKYKGKDYYLKYKFSDGKTFLISKTPDMKKAFCITINEQSDEKKAK